MRIVHPITEMCCKHLITSPIFLQVSLLFIYSCLQIISWHSFSPWYWTVKCHIGVCKLYSSAPPPARLLISCIILTDQSENSITLTDQSEARLLISCIIQSPEEARAGQRAVPGVHAGRGGGRRPLKLPRNRHRRRALADRWRQSSVKMSSPVNV